MEVAPKAKRVLTMQSAILTIREDTHEMIYYVLV